MSIHQSLDSSSRYGFSLTGVSSGNYSIASTVGDDDAHSNKLHEYLSYREQIASFERLKKDEHFDLKPSWSGMNIKPVTSDQVDMRILAQRVHTIIDFALLQTQLMCALPTLLENDGKILRQWFRRRDADFVIRRLKKPIHSTEDVGTRHIKTVTGFKVDNELQLAFRMLASNKCFPIYIAKHPPQVTKYVEYFTNVFNEFNNLVTRQMAMTAYEAGTRKVNLRKLYEQLRERRVEMKRFEDSMNENLHEHELRMQAREEQIEIFRGKLQDTLDYYNGLMDKTLQFSDKTLYILAEKSQVVKTELAETAKQSKISYAQIRSDHLIEEQHLRTRKIKLEAQLSIWLGKYDMDVGERQNEFEAITEVLERERGELQELECLLMEQEKIYERYQIEKLDKESTEFEERVYAVVAKRAAKIIQRYWRAYLQRRGTKKGKGKGKGKKKK